MQIDLNTVSTIRCLILDEHEFPSRHLIQQVGTLHIRLTQTAPVQLSGLNFNAIYNPDARGCGIRAPGVCVNEVFFNWSLGTSSELIIELAKDLLGADNAGNVGINVARECAPFQIFQLNSPS